MAGEHRLHSLFVVVVRIAVFFVAITFHFEHAPVRGELDLNTLFPDLDFDLVTKFSVFLLNF